MNEEIKMPEFLTKKEDYGETDIPKTTNSSPEISETPEEKLARCKREGKVGRYPWEKGSDPVNHPSHYQSKNGSGLEVIHVIEAFTDGLNGIEAADTANVIKYICRWKDKNGIEDLEKAQWYLNHLISRVKKRMREEDNNE